MADTSDDPIRHARALLEGGELSTLRDLAQATGLAPRRLREAFLRRYGLSPADYLAHCRLQGLRRALRGGAGATAAVYEAGYGSPSRVYRDGAARLGMTPGRYARGGDGVEILYTVVDTRLGPTLIATTLRGLCAVWPGIDPSRVREALAAEFPRALLRRVDEGADEVLAPRVREAAAALAGGPHRPLSLELVGTAFQHRVWQALMLTRPGERISYAELARRIDRPDAVRAVASACAGNRVAVLVPCHRVLRSDGGAGGYRWGLPLKQALLDREAGVEGPD